VTILSSIPFASFLCKAISYYDKALAIEPNDVVVLEDKNSALDLLGRYNEAIVYYDKALTLDLRNVDNYTQAIQYYDRALAIEPTYTGPLTGKGLAFISWEVIFKLLFIMIKR
jgi:tetratricopeptide (TPR) repeat protein